jgi:hypothetical protein
MKPDNPRTPQTTKHAASASWAEKSISQKRTANAPEEKVFQEAGHGIRATLLRD